MHAANFRRHMKSVRLWSNKKGYLADVEYWSLILNVCVLDDLQVVHLRNNFAVNGAVAGGVELCDLTAQTIPRRLHFSGKATLEQVHFVKLKDVNAFDNALPEREKLDKYRNLCRSVLFEGLEQWNTERLRSLPSGSVFEQIFKELKGAEAVEEEYMLACMEDTKCTLFQLLRKVFATEVITDLNAFANNVVNTMKSEMESLRTDILWHQAWYPKTINPMLTAVAQNTAGHYYNCCTVEPRSIDVIKWCRDLQMSGPLIDVDWTMLSPEFGNFESEVLSQNDVKSVQVDLESGHVIPDSARNFDVVMLDRVLSKKADIPSYIQKLKELIRDDGFLVICEPTSDFELALMVEGLQGSLLPASGDGSRIYGMFLKHQDWVKLFEDTGFKITHIQSDICMISTVYMIRKLPSVPRQPTFINVDDVVNFTWIEHLQQVIEDNLNEPELRTIWVTSTERRDNGATGLALCLREESSKVNRFRRICDVSLKNRDEPAVLDLESKEVQEQITIDLFATDYRDGTWGSFVHTAIKEGKCDSSSIHIPSNHSSPSINSSPAQSFYTGIPMSPFKTELPTVLSGL